MDKRPFCEGVYLYQLARLASPLDAYPNKDGTLTRPGAMVVAVSHICVPLGVNVENESVKVNWVESQALSHSKK